MPLLASHNILQSGLTQIKSQKMMRPVVSPGGAPQGAPLQTVHSRQAGSPHNLDQQTQTKDAV